MMNGKIYIQKLKEAYEKRGFINKWNHLFNIAHGISEEDKRLLMGEYPEFPKSLMEILETIDGTYWRQYGDEKVTFFFFGWVVVYGRYTYYLFSL